MIQLILKTLIRALLIFLPVAYLSLGKDSSVGRYTSLTPYGIVVIMILLFSLVIAVVLLAKSRMVARNNKTRETIDFESIVEQNR